MMEGGITISSVGSNLAAEAQTHREYMRIYGEKTDTYTKKEEKGSLLEMRWNGRIDNKQVNDNVHYNHVYIFLTTIYKENTSSYSWYKHTKAYFHDN